MPNELQSLWPSQIRPKILSPKTILLAQAEALVKQTGGVLLAEIKQQEVDSGKVIMDFDIVVPALDGYRHRILTVSHAKGLLYPVVVDADIFHPTGLNIIRDIFVRTQTEIASAVERKPANRADDDSELIGLIAAILKSPQVISAAQSLIALATDALAEKGGQSEPSSSIATTSDDSANVYSGEERPNSSTNMGN